MNFNPSTSSGAYIPNESKTCALHGVFYGWACPSCSSGASLASSFDPALARIAHALERIAVSLEKAEASWL